jgi:hypothetical protein
VKIKVIDSISAEMDPRIYDFGGKSELLVCTNWEGVKRGIFVLFDFPLFVFVLRFLAGVNRLLGKWLGRPVAGS